jgi:ribosomal protein S12 methylthiotransferase
VDGLRWIRPFYLYPQQVDEALIDLYAGQDKIAKYIDMPLQHINDTMLKAMHRLGNKRYITNLVNRLRQRIPGLTFRTAFIVGFPGETNAQFHELKQYLTEMEFDRVGIFVYSDEDDTPAVEFLGKLDRTLMEDRRTELLDLQETISLKRGQQKIGSMLEVLVEGPSEETDLLIASRHEGQAPEIDGLVYINDIEDSAENTDLIQIHRDAAVPRPGDLVKVQITEAAAYDLVGHIVR